MLRLLPLLAVSALLARGETLEFDLKAGQIQSVTLPSKVDDSHFRLPLEPDLPAEAPRVFTRRIDLLNAGARPLVGRLMLVNRREIQSAEGFETALGSTDGRVAMERLFMFWRDHRTTADSGAKLAGEPFAALNFWGFTAPSDDALALARLARVFDMNARHVAFQGHLAAEFEYDSAWHLIDGARAACYLRLDNRTPASAAEIRADPFLALRTKVFGRSRPMSRPVSTRNTALFEQIALMEPKAIRLKMGPAPLNTFTLQPSESIIWHGKPPETPAGKGEAENPAVLAAATLGTIEHRLNLSHRERPEKDVVTVNEPFPILKIVNETTGESNTLKEIAFKASIPIKAETDKVTVYMQCSRLALPLLSKGENQVLLDAEGGKARVAYHYDPAPAAVLANVRVVPTSKNGRFEGSPSFTVTSAPAAERWWWQVSASRDFSFVPPNFDTVGAAAPTLKFDPFTETFLNAGRPYFLRVKVQAGGVWSEWTPGVPFQLERPPQPSTPRFGAIPGGGVRLSWEGAGEEFAVYGSNRADFVPEPFGVEEIVAMEEDKVTETRPNKNLIAKVKQPEVELTPRFHFYRVIARKAGADSVPGPLWRLPAEFAAKVPAPPMVLQIRPAKTGDKVTTRVVEEKLIPKPVPPPAEKKEKEGKDERKEKKDEPEKPPKP